jgi:hypothetical protein
LRTSPPPKLTARRWKIFRYYHSEVPELECVPYRLKSQRRFWVSQVPNAALKRLFAELP